MGLVYGGCMICTGDSATPDPSGSDNPSPATFTVRNLLQDGSPPELHWSVQETRGFAQLAPRKDHALAIVGCDAPGSDSFAAESVTALDSAPHAQVSDCAMYAYGGWNPRWPDAGVGTQALTKLSLDTNTWTAIPAEADLVRCIWKVFWHSMSMMLMMIHLQDGEVHRPVLMR